MLIRLYFFESVSVQSVILSGVKDEHSYPTYHCRLVIDRCDATDGPGVNGTRWQVRPGA